MLFEKYTLAGKALNNRMVMAPMTRTRANDDRVPTDLMLEYYVQRATAGLIVTECSPVRNDSAGIMRAPGIYSQAHVDGWKKITDAVHAAGGKMYLQIWHCGRISHSSLQPGGELPIAPSAIAANGQIFTANGPKTFPTPRALELSEIAPLIEAFGAATEKARCAGFDGAELHGAFGYLPDQFLQDGTNTRTDAYGGSIVNRARFMLETVEAMIGKWDAAHIGVKLSPSTRFYGQRDSDPRATYSHMVSELDALKIGYIHVMGPTSNDLATGAVQIDDTMAAFRPLFSRTVIINGGFDKEKAEAALTAGAADLVSFGVPFIANPDLVKRFETDAALNAPDPTSFYGFGPEGYTDYPCLAA